MQKPDSAVDLYFQTVNAAFAGLEIYLDEASRQSQGDAAASAILMTYIERLRASMRCWENRIGFSDRFRISRAESGFPVFQNVLELENDRRGAPERLNQLPPAEKIRAEMADFILRTRSFPEALKMRMAERLYLEEVMEGEVFSPIVLPVTTSVDIGRDSGRPSVVVHWGSFDGSQTLPLIYIARIEDSSENLARLLLTREGRLNADMPIPFPVGGLLNPDLAARFDDFVIRNSGYALSPVTIAANMDRDFPTLHPKQMRRIVVGPFYSSGITENNETINTILARVSKAENAWLLTWTIQDVLSLKEKPESRGFFSSTPALQEFHINTNDLEASRMGVSSFEKHALVPHEAYTALYAAGEAERTFAGFKVHVISGNQVTSGV